MTKQSIRITIAVDDVHPEPGWGMQDDQAMKWMDTLHKDFGAKFTLFIPSNYHGRAPISQHRGWIHWLDSLGYMELAAHGHFHETSDRRRFGECEFYELTDPAAIRTRIEMMFDEWINVGELPRGWRSPGWLASPQAAYELSTDFFYAAIHTDHDSPRNWLCSTVQGHDGIHSGEVTLHQQDCIMFQSHIAGDWNDNVWNQHNFDQLWSSLAHLTGIYDVTFCTIGEIIPERV